MSIFNQHTYELHKNYQEKTLHLSVLIHFLDSEKYTYILIAFLFTIHICVLQQKALTLIQYFNAYPLYVYCFSIFIHSGPVRITTNCQHASVLIRHKLFEEHLHVALLAFQTVLLFNRYYTVNQLNESQCELLQTQYSFIYYIRNCWARNFIILKVWHSSFILTYSTFIQKIYVENFMLFDIYNQFIIVIFTIRI